MGSIVKGIAGAVEAPFKAVGAVIATPFKAGDALLHGNIGGALGDLIKGPVQAVGDLAQGGLGLAQGVLGNKLVGAGIGALIGGGTTLGLGTLVGGAAGYAGSSLANKLLGGLSNVVGDVTGASPTVQQSQNSSQVGSANSQLSSQEQLAQAQQYQLPAPPPMPSFSQDSLGS